MGLLSPLPSAICAPDITAADILRAVREGQASRRETLNGQLRNDADGKVFPFQLVANGPLVRYQFKGPPAATVQVRYNKEDSDLEESIAGGGAERMTPANYDKPILGTDMTYEDLALRFVYWGRSSIQEEDNSTTFPAYKLKMTAPTRRSQYSYVLLWVGKDSGALLRAEGYDWQGRLIKRFEVRSGQKIEGRWYLKQMRIETVKPENGKVGSRTYLEIKGVEK
jgi:hypothetical protein